MEHLVPMEIVQLIKEKPAVAYIIIKNNMQLIIELSGGSATSEEIEQGIYRLLLELEAEQKELFTGEVN